MIVVYVGEKVCYLVVIIKVNGVKCCVLFDIGVIGFYILVFLVNFLKVKFFCILICGIKMIMGLVIKCVEIYDVKICDI